MNQNSKATADALNEALKQLQIISVNLNVLAATLSNINHNFATFCAKTFGEDVKEVDANGEVIRKEEETEEDASSGVGEVGENPEEQEEVAAGEAATEDESVAAEDELANGQD